MSIPTASNTEIFTPIETISINPASTSYPGTVASTPGNFTSYGPTTDYSVAAVLTASGTIITAFELSGSSGLAIVDGSTLTEQGRITLSDGVVVSLGSNGLVGASTTANYQPIVVSNSQAGSQTAVGTATRDTTVTASSTQASESSEESADPSSETPAAVSGSSSSSSDIAAPTLVAGKAVALIGALGGMLFYGL